MNDDVAISVKNVYKDFKLPHEKVTSVKSAFTGVLRGKSSLRYEKQHALKDISFEIKKGEFFGVVGRNGSGKSTLLKIIAQIYQPTKGTVLVNGKLVPFIELGVGFNPELTGRENVYLNGAILGFTNEQIDKNYKEIVEFAELEEFMDQKLKNYSSGMQVRLAFACATKAEADILLVDEVLAVGDSDFQRKCFNFFKDLKRQNKTVVFVTHDMDAVREYCDRAILIDNSEILYCGISSDAAMKYSKLFVAKNTNSVNSKDDRWGSFNAKIHKLDVNLSGDNVKINFTVKVNADIDAMLCGIHIIAADGKEVTATNNRMIGVADEKGLKKGDVINISWEILNIFSDGIYDVTLTLVESSGVVLDWYERASSFQVKKEMRSTTSVIPPTTLSINKELRKKNA